MPVLRARRRAGVDAAGRGNRLRHLAADARPAGHGHRERGPERVVGRLIGRELVRVEHAGPVDRDQPVAQRIPPAVVVVPGLAVAIDRQLLEARGHRPDRTDLVRPDAVLAQHGAEHPPRSEPRRLQRAGCLRCGSRCRGRSLGRGRHLVLRRAQPRRRRDHDGQDSRRTAGNRQPGPASPDPPGPGDDVIGRRPWCRRCLLHRFQHVPDVIRHGRSLPLRAS